MRCHESKKCLCDLAYSSQLSVTWFIIFDIVFCSYSLNIPNLMMNIIQITLYIWINHFLELTFGIWSCFEKSWLCDLHTAVSGQSFDTFQHDCFLQMFTKYAQYHHDYYSNCFIYLNQWFSFTYICHFIMFWKKMSLWPCIQQSVLSQYS